MNTPKDVSSGLFICSLLADVSTMYCVTFDKKKIKEIHMMMMTVIKLTHN